MFVQEHAMGFLGLCESASKERHKATTPNGAPQGEGHTVFFLCLFNLVSKNRHKATRPNCVPQVKRDCCGIICKLKCCLVCCSSDSKFI